MGFKFLFQRLLSIFEASTDFFQNDFSKKKKKKKESAEATSLLPPIHHLPLVIRQDSEPFPWSKRPA